MLKALSFLLIIGTALAAGAVPCYPAPKVRAEKPRFVVSEQTVKDGETGLVWLRDGNNAGQKLSWDDAHEHIALLNGQNYAGHSDWRLPDLDELKKLQGAAKKARLAGFCDNDAIVRHLCRDGFKNVQAGNYWSATTSMFNDVEAWYMGMPSGSGATLNKAQTQYVFLVRTAGGHATGASRKKTYAPKPTPQPRETGGGLQSDSTTTTTKKRSAVPRFVVSEQIVKDAETGLVWLRDGNNAGQKLSWDDAHEYIALLNGQNYAGHSDWRLPDLDELKKLQGAAKKARLAGFCDNDAIVSHLCRDGFKNVQAGNYWSATTSMFNDVEAWYMGMPSGSGATLNKAQTLYLFLVRTADGHAAGASREKTYTPKPVPQPRETGGGLQSDSTTTTTKKRAAVPRFVVSEQTVKDAETGLVWLRDGNNAGQKLSWDDAHEYIALLNGQNYAGHSDWRLPDLDELKKLQGAAKKARMADFACGSGAVSPLCSEGFINVQTGGYWSATTSMFYYTDAWFVEIATGSRATENKGIYMFVWPVCGGERLIE